MRQEFLLKSFPSYFSLNLIYHGSFSFFAISGESKCTADRVLDNPWRKQNQSDDFGYPFF